MEPRSIRVPVAPWHFRPSGARFTSNLCPLRRLSEPSRERPSLDIPKLPTASRGRVTYHTSQTVTHYTRAVNCSWDPRAWMLETPTCTPDDGVLFSGSTETIGLRQPAKTYQSAPSAYTLWQHDTWKHGRYRRAVENGKHRNFRAISAPRPTVLAPGGHSGPLDLCAHENATERQYNNDLDAGTKDGY